MHPKALLDSCSELLKQVLKFDYPADMVLSRSFREFRLGPRERATLAETIYGVLRKKNLYTYLAQHGSGAPERGSTIVAPVQVVVCVALGTLNFSPGVTALVATPADGMSAAGNSWPSDISW